MLDRGEQLGVALPRVSYSQERHSKPGAHGTIGAKHLITNESDGSRQDEGNLDQNITDYSTVLYKECWERILRQIFMFDALILVRVDVQRRRKRNNFFFLFVPQRHRFPCTNGQGDFAPTALLSLFIAYRHRLGPVSTSQCI